MSDSGERKKDRISGDYVEIIPMEGQYVAVLKRQTAERRGALVVPCAASSYSGTFEAPLLDSNSLATAQPADEANSSLRDCRDQVRRAASSVQSLRIVTHAGKLTQNFVLMLLIFSAFLIGYQGSIKPKAEPLGPKIEVAAAPTLTKEDENFIIPAPLAPAETEAQEKFARVFAPAPVEPPASQEITAGLPQALGPVTLQHLRAETAFPVAGDRL